MQGHESFICESDMAIQVAVVFHSGYGHTARLAQAVAQGAASVAGVETHLITVDDADESWELLERADAIIFGTPTYMAGPSAQFKAFEEATSSKIMTAGFRWRDKVAAGFTNSGARSGDKLATLIQLALFAAQHGMHWVNLDLPPANNSSRGSEEELNRLGFWLGAGAQSNVDQGPDLAPPEADLATARYLGQRVATVTRQLARGKRGLNCPESFHLRRAYRGGVAVLGSWQYILRFCSPLDPWVGRSNWGVGRQGARACPSAGRSRESAGLRARANRAWPVRLTIRSRQPRFASTRRSTVRRRQRLPLGPFSTCPRKQVRSSPREA